MPSKIIERIQVESGVPQLLELLAERLPSSDLQSLLLEAFRHRASVQTPASILARAAGGILFAPSDVDARQLHDVERCALEAAEDFESVELSPALPLGTHAGLGGIEQNNVLTTIRNGEVSGDPTSGLAVAASLRRRAAGAPGGGREAEIHLCASQRVVRLQPFDVPGFSPHFKLFCLVSAGRDKGNFGFELEQLRRHLRVYLRFFRKLNQRGFDMREPLVEVSDHRVTAGLLARAGIGPNEVSEQVRAHQLGGTERFFESHGISVPEHSTGPVQDFPGLPCEALAAVQDRVFPPLQEEFPEAEFRLRIARLEGFGYYRGLCLRVSPVATDGQRNPIADGGAVDWTARLLANGKERLLASGIGIEFICRRYARA